MFFVLIVNRIWCKVKMNRGTEEEHVDLRAVDLCTVIRKWDRT